MDGICSHDLEAAVETRTIVFLENNSKVSEQWFPPFQGCGIKGFLSTSVIQGNLPLYMKKIVFGVPPFLLYHILWIPFPTAFPGLHFPFVDPPKVAASFVSMDPESFGFGWTSSDASWFFWSHFVFWFLAEGWIPSLAGVFWLQKPKIRPWEKLDRP